MNAALSPAKYAAQLEQIPEADSPQDLEQTARAAAQKLHTDPAATVDDLFRVADALGIDASVLLRMATR